MRSSNTEKSTDQPATGGNGAAPPSPSIVSPSETPSERPRDYFDDLDQIRINPAQQQVSTNKQLLHIPPRKPKAKEFFRVHPDPAMSISAISYQDEDERECYLVLGSCVEIIKPFVRMATIVLCINRQGSIFLWPVQLPDSERRSNGAWIETRRVVMEMAKDRWVSLRADMDNRCFEAVLAGAELPEPVWPAKTFQEWLRLGYSKRIIDSADHPIIRGLLGLI
jgi:hypothetical protein